MQTNDFDPSKLLADSGVDLDPDFDKKQPFSYKDIGQMTKAEKEELLLDRFFPRVSDQGTTLEDLQRLPESGITSGKLQVDNRPDDVVKLTKPLAQYSDRVFFYAGYLNAFCRIRTSVTERFRAAANTELVSALYPLQNPVATIATYGAFSQTQTASLLWSVEKTLQGRAFFEYLLSNTVVVEQTLEGVKALRLELVRAADPYAVDNGQTPGYIDLLVFVPYSYSTDLEITPGNILTGQPFTVRIKDKHDRDLETRAKEILGAKNS